MNKIGILTFHWADDFGGMLQAYALKQFLNSRKIGDAEIIPYKTAALRGRYWIIPYRPKYANRPITGAMIKREAKFALRNMPYKLRRMWKMACFRKRHLTDKPGISRICSTDYDTVVLGSDQIWNPDITYRLEPAYFGAFPKKDSTITVSYAASLGKPSLDVQYTNQLRKLLKNVDVISVREETSLEYVKENAGKEVQWMPDPTLLLTGDEWKRIVAVPAEMEYVLLHYTEYNPELVSQAVAYATQHGLKLVSLKPIHVPGADIEIRFDIGPEEFLGYILNAECVFTNSFHATVFSILFQKPFSCMAHKTLGSRTNDLLSKFGIEMDANSVVSPEQYVSCAEKLQEYRDRAYQYLLNSTSYKRADITEHCKGCAACALVCPEKAILMKMHQDGFCYPYINEQICTNCGKCSRICPDHMKINPADNQMILGCKCKSEEIRARSTSGGAFYLLSEQILQQGGCVYGVVLDSEHRARHVCAESMVEVLPMQGAKYVESELGDCFQKIKIQLANRTVLFSGTPCQVAGLKRYVGDHPNLYTIDIVCHGIASPKVYQKYIGSLEKKGSVSEFCFRNKVSGWHTSSVSYFQNGKQCLQSMGENPYTKLYFRGLISRESCHSCQYASISRCSDLTLGDYWGVEKHHPEFDDNRGISLMILHSQKGQKLFDSIKENMEFMIVSQEQCMQPQLSYPAPRNPQRDNLFMDLDKFEFESLFKKYYLISHRHFWETLRKRLLN